MKHFAKWAWVGFWVLATNTVALAAPLNDNFADRIVLSGAAVSAVGTTVAGTLEEGEPQVFHVLSTVWYQWVAPRAGQVRVRIADSPHTLLVHMHSGTVLGGLERVRTIWSNSEGNIDVQEGATYQFQIGPNQPVPWPRFEGPFTLRLEYNVAPANDHFTNRIRLTNRVERITFRNVLATLETAETLLSPGGGYSVWYEWRAPESGLAHILTDNSHSTVVGVYQGSLPNAGNMITNSQIGGGNCWGEVTFATVAGQSYQITFDNCSGLPGDGAATLTLNGAARLEAPRNRPEGGMQMTLYGERYRTYVFQASSNLADWRALSTNMFYDALVLEDAEAASQARRFYRVRLEP